MLCQNKLVEIVFELIKRKRGESVMMKISGKTAVVIGGGSGIGKSIALALANEGANVVIADIEKQSCRRSLS